ncbi:hypothetical protein Ae263Ps1_6244c [Pseudonocardia sp. Ae263_Ps1]|nr:hypothetical protein Ae263Ps1_6244c [Pseudonocardia sp. Ae263_Ps1]
MDDPMALVRGAGAGRDLVAPAGRPGPAFGRPGQPRGTT